MAAIAVILGVSPAHGATALTADRILVEKAAHRLTLFYKGERVKSYKVSLGRSLAPKERQGDGRTPEGLYRIDFRKPDSSYHRALHISYPDDRDKARAAAGSYDPGGDIMIHGIRNGLGWLGRLHRLRDWTAGCVAVTDKEIEEIWDAVPDGVEVEIRP